MPGPGKMGKKLPETQLKTGDAGAVGVASRTRSRGRRVDPRPKLPSSPKSDQELGLPRRGRAKQFDANVCHSWLTPCSFPAHISILAAFPIFLGIELCKDVGVASKRA